MIQSKIRPKNTSQNIKNKKNVQKISNNNIKRKSAKKRTNTSSNNSSINKSNNNIIKNKETPIIQEEIKKDKQIKIDNDLIKKQYKIIKDFLTPILKEENARQLVSIYDKRMGKEKNPVKRNKRSSMKNRGILDYSFMNEKSSKNKIRIPLFQILYPNQYKKYLEKRLKQKKHYPINRSCRHKNNSNTDIQKTKQVKILVNKSNSSININVNNLNKDNKDNNKKSKNSNTNKAIRSKTPPLYLRLDDVEKKHKKEIEKLKKKYEIKYNNNNSDTTTSQNDSYKSRNRKANFEKWYNYEKTWEKMKDIKLKMIKDEIEENKIYMNQNIKDEETFKPKINKKSEFLVNKKYDGDFHLRLKSYLNDKDKKAKMLQKKFEPSFKPYVNNSYRIKSEYYDYMKYDQKLINRDFNYFLGEY